MERPRTTLRKAVKSSEVLFTGMCRFFFMKFELTKIRLRWKLVGEWYSSDAIASEEMLDPFANEWRVVARMPKRRYSVGVGVLNNLLYAIGEQDGISCLHLVEK